MCHKMMKSHITAASFLLLLVDLYLEWSDRFLGGAAAITSTAAACTSVVAVSRRVILHLDYCNTAQNHRNEPPPPTSMRHFCFILAQNSHASPMPNLPY